MRRLQHHIAEARAAARNLSARLGPLQPADLRPARLVLRLDDADLPGSLGEGAPLAEAALQARIAEAVGWLGPLPVTVFSAGIDAEGPAIELLRFAHRLDNATTLVTAGLGLDERVALALMDAGLGRLCLRLDADSAAPGSPAQGALKALRFARNARQAPLDLECWLPWEGASAAAAPALLLWARAAGADGLRVVAPWRAEDLSPAPPPAAAPPFDRTDPGTRALLARMKDATPGPGADGRSALRRPFGPCPVGGQRLELTLNGRLCACPFQVPIPGDGALASRVATGASDHLQAISACDRVCAHPELVPAPLGPTRSPWPG